MKWLAPICGLAALMALADDACGQSRSRRTRSTGRTIVPSQSSTPYRTAYPANYGPGTGKSGPAGQRLYVHRVPYQSSSSGYTPRVTGPRTTNPPPAGGTPRQKKSFGYDDNRSKTQ